MIGVSRWKQLEGDEKADEYIGVRLYFYKRK